MLTGVLLAGSTLLCGCLNTGVKQSTPPKPFVPEADVSKVMELPAKEGARACLAAAQLLEKEGKYPEAIALYEKARSQDPALKHLCRRLAVLHDRLFDYSKAEQEYVVALAMYPRDAHLLNDAGYSQFCRSNFAEAENFLRQAIKIDPNLKKARINLGMVQVQQRKPEQALDTFRTVVPEAHAHCNLAYGYTMHGNRKGAIAEYRKALDLMPDLDRARAALTELENPSRSRIAAAAHKKAASDSANVQSAPAKSDPARVIEPANFAENIANPGFAAGRGNE